MNRNPNLKALEQLSNERTSDGIINLEKYCQAPHKILWILKETNGKDLPLAWALHDTASKKNWKGFHKTYRRVVQVSYAILGNNWNSVCDAKKEFFDIISQIAVININKEGGGSTSYEQEILDCYHKNKQLLMRQIEAINPDIIINANHVNEIFDKGELFEAVTERKYKKACIEFPMRKKGGTFMIGKYSETRQWVLNIPHPQSTQLNDAEYLLLIKKCFDECPLA